MRSIITQNSAFIEKKKIIINTTLLVLITN